MRKRRRTVMLRLDDDELVYLHMLVEKSGLSQEAYLRSIISGIVPAERPPPDYHTMMRELHAIGNNLNQIAKKAHNLGVIDARRYSEVVNELSEAVVRIGQEVKRGRRI